MNINNYDVISDLYDTYVPATFDIDFFIREAQKAPGEVLELMSGTGRVSIPLLQAGVQLTCVDISEELNRVFQKKLKLSGLRADVYKMDVCELDLPKKFNQIIIPFHSFAHIVSVEDQRKALERISHHLLPGGSFICTLGNPAVRQKSVDGQLRLYREYPLPNEKGTLLLWIVETRDPGDKAIIHARQFYEEYDPKGVLASKRLLELHFRLSTKEEFERLVLDTGFTIKALYGDYSYADFCQDQSPFMIYMMEKTG